MHLFEMENFVLIYKLFFVSRGQSDGVEMGEWATSSVQELALWDQNENVGATSGKLTPVTRWLLPKDAARSEARNSSIATHLRTRET